MGSDLSSLVSAAVAEVAASLDLSTYPNPAAAVHTALWPHVERAVAHLDPAAAHAPTPPPGDRRAKRWQYVARFWLQTPLGPELVGETEPDVLEGTGAVVGLVRQLAAQLHECGLNELPEELSTDALKARLPQLRNNLGRQRTAALRIPYAFTELSEDGTGGEVSEYLCQVDIHRLEQ